jgi:hypothetical protein
MRRRDQDNRRGIASSHIKLLERLTQTPAVSAAIGRLICVHSTFYRDAAFERFFSNRSRQHECYDHPIHTALILDSATQF